MKMMVKIQQNKQLKIIGAALQREARDSQCLLTAMLSNVKAQHMR